MFKKFLKDESGNIAIIGSLAMIPLVLLTSLAVDHASTVSKESRLQDAIDVAALTAIKEPKKNEALKVFKDILSAHDEMDFKIVDFDRRQRGARIELTAKVTGKHEPMFKSLAGVNSVPFETETTVTAATKLSGIRFTPTFGSGYLDKEFQLWVNRPNRPSPELLATYNWRSTAPFTFRNGTSPGYLRASTRGSIDLGEFTDFFMTVEVYDRWNTYTREQLVEVYGQDYKLASNEPGHGDHFVVNGRVLDVDEAVDFSSEFNCDTGRQNFEWEDAPGLAQVGTDFRFNVSGECNALDPDTLRISR